MSWSDLDMRKQQALNIGTTSYSRWHWKIQFVPQDCWVGLYWVHDVQGWDGGWWESWRFYLTIIPMLPIRLIVDRSNRDTRAYRRWQAAQRRS